MISVQLIGYGGVYFQTPYQAGIVPNQIRIGKHIFHYIHSFYTSGSARRVNHLHLIAAIQHHGKLIQILLLHVKQDTSPGILTTHQTQTIG